MKHLIRITLITILLNNSYAIELSTLSFNIAALNPLSKNTQQRISKFCKMISKKDYDVLFIQEAWITKFRKQIISQCSFAHFLDLDKISGIKRRVENNEITSYKAIFLSKLIDWLYPNIGADSGLMILSKYPLTRPKKLIFSNNGSQETLFDGEIAVNKGAIIATLVHPKAGKINVATTHLVANYGGTKYDSQRTTQLEELSYWIKENSKSLPTIIGGDFNISPPLRYGHRKNKTERMWDNFKNKYFKDFNFTKKDYSSLTTFHRKGAKDNEGVIDHIISLNGVKHTSTSIIKNTELSDHFAVESILKILR